jgi:hypothetical protein
MDHRIDKYTNKLIYKNSQKKITTQITPNPQLNYFQHEGVTTRSQASFFNSKANLIKRCFKNFVHSKASPQLNLVDFSTKKIIEEEMIKLNRMIKNSNSAIMTNMEASNDIVYIQTCEEDLDYHPYYLCATENLLFDEEKIPQKSDAIYVLKGFIKEKNMICNELALYMAIALNSNSNIPLYLKNEIYVCTVHGHTICCIFKPESENNNNCIVIDPWIFYLNLKAHQDYRAQQVPHIKNRTRGFIGNLLQYRKFLKTHPNSYVPEDQDPEFTIMVEMSNIAKQITLAEII